MGAWTEIVDFTFTANETSRTFSGLSITKNDFIKVVFTSTNPQTQDNAISLLANSSSSSNYHTQSLGGSGTSVFASRTNTNFIGETEKNSTTSSYVGFLKLSENDRLNLFFQSNKRNTSDIITEFNYITSSGATFSSGITSLTFTGNRTDGIGTGSRIQIYRLDAEKVADIITTANATQVDISSLSIGKDSEYLLVGNYIRNAGDLELGVNDNTTLTNYYSQQIRGNGSTASAARRNEPRIVDASGTTTNVFYGHIKLSEIGAFTAQLYVLKDSATTAPMVDNFFISSTAENITSVTKINLFSNGTNGIGSGSRFELYKLK
jgi:hypothetical protein